MANPFHPDDRREYPRPFTTFRDLDEGETFIEYEGSTILLPVTAVVNGEEIQERIKMRAFMRAEILPPYLGGHGTREFQFTIRDWDLFGPSRLLSQLYYGDARGRLVDSDAPERGRQLATMTWTLARHYVKRGDDYHDALGPIDDDTRIDGQTYHNTDDGTLYWQLDGGEGDAFNVLFFRSAEQDREDLVARATGVRAGEHFVASSDGPLEMSPANLPMRRETHPGGLNISWQLGRAPRAGATGSVRSLSQPRSICVAEQPPIPGLGEDSADFPARITYAANYEVWVDGERVAEDQMGVALAHGCRSIPPRDVSVQFHKPLTSDRFSFANGACRGMLEMTRDEYLAGMQLTAETRARVF